MEQILAILMEHGLPVELAWAIVYRWGGVEHPLAIAYRTSPERRQYKRMFDSLGRRMRLCVECVTGRRDIGELARWDGEFVKSWSTTGICRRVPKLVVGHVWRLPGRDAHGQYYGRRAHDGGDSTQWSRRQVLCYGCGTASLWRRHFDLTEPSHNPASIVQHYVDPVNVAAEQYHDMTKARLWLAICWTGDDATREHAQPRMEEYCARGRTDLIRLALRF